MAGVEVHSKWGLMCSALVGASLLALEPAAAQSLSDSEKIERLQRQTEQLQKQLKALQEEIAQTKKKTEKVEAAQAKEAVPAGHAAPTPDRDPTKSPPAKAPAWTDKVKITLGGFVTADTVFRARNQVNDIGTNFTQIPYPFSPLYGEHEFHGSARQSRLSLLVEGNITAVQKLSGYWESDFLGVATNSNYIETNSWAMRMRHAYVTYDNTAWGFHLLGGQSWSLVTQNTVGITPRKENIPLTIDADYVDGFNYTRGWQIRLVPDVIEKVAFDPGWGHYEVFGIERWFSDNTFCAVSAPTGCALNTTSLKTSFGAAVGGSVLLPLIPKYVFRLRSEEHTS